MSKKHTFEYVKEYFEEQGCELLEEEYKNARFKMKYKCNCGNISETIFNNFKKGSRCSKCGGSKKLTFKYVQQFFNDHGCELLEKEYKNNKIPLKYRCKCGNISIIKFDNFKRGQRCIKCNGREKHTLEYVKQYFKNQGCELLEGKYINNSTLMKYKCLCGNISEIVFKSFRAGNKCMKCAIKNRSGENSSLWNPNLTNEERETNKTRVSDYLYIKWRKKIYKRDNYICQKCSQRGKILNAHHIEGYSENKDLRLEESNGITFCRKCHKQFHKKYGIKNVNRQQLKFFI